MYHNPHNKYQYLFTFSRYATCCLICLVGKIHKHLKTLILFSHNDTNLGMILKNGMIHNSIVRFLTTTFFFNLVSARSTLPFWHDLSSLCDFRLLSPTCLVLWLYLYISFKPTTSKSFLNFSILCILLNLVKPEYFFLNTVFFS